MIKAFDTVNIHKLINKIMQTNIPNNIPKFLANYLKARQAFTMLQNVSSRKQNLKTRVPQEGVFSPTLFNIYMSDLPKPPENVQTEVYADDIMALSSSNQYQIDKQDL